MVPVGRKSRVLVGGIVALAVAIGVGGFGLARWMSSDAGASQAQPFGDAIAVLQQDDGTVAATVNGQPIPYAKLKAYTVLSSAGTALGIPGPASQADYLQSLIDSELMFQEARRRGFTPSDQEIKAAATQSKESLLKAMKGDTEGGKKLREMFAQLVGTPYHVDVYDSSAVMLDAFRRQLAKGALRSAILQQLSASDRDDPMKRDAAFTAVLSEVRGRSDIRILVEPTK